MTIKSYARALNERGDFKCSGFSSNTEVQYRQDITHLSCNKFGKVTDISLLYLAGE